MKNLVRMLFFPIAVICGGEFKAQEGTLWFKFLQWLYEDAMEPEFNVQWPEEETNESRTPEGQ